MARERMKKEKEERGRADEMAGAVFEFFSSLMPMTMEEVSQLSAEDEDGAEFIELPVPSPDSITVTTEFGVSEEPNNVTVITAVGPPPAAHEGEVEEIENLAHVVVEELGMVQMQLPHSLLASVGMMNSSTEIDTEGDTEIDTEDDTDDMLDDDGDDADIDTDDFDAESTIIDQFIDDGALTPTTAIPSFSH